MTDDYKDTLLRYFSGNLTRTPIYYNIPQFQETTSSESNIYTYIYTNVGVGFTELGILQGYNSAYSIIYGNDSNDKGFMVILDESNTPVQFINSYSSGTAFGKFQILNVAEDGNFYGIDINNGTPRFIMLNNIVLVLPNQESFSVKLRQSYNLPSPLSTAISYFDIKKAVGQGKYLIGAIYNSPLNKKSPLITELTINVGSTNDWVNYNMDLTDWSFNGCSMWASWDNDELDFSMNGYYDDGTKINYIEFAKDNESQTNFNIRALENLDIAGYSEGYYNVNTLLISKDDGYIGVYDGGYFGTDEVNIIYYCKGGSSQFELVGVFQKGTQLPYTDIDRKVQLKNINGNVFFMCKCYEKYTGIDDLYIYYGIIITDYDGSKRSISTNVVTDGQTWRYDLLVSNIYNLYTYNVLSLDFNNNTSVGSNYSTKQIYNTNNYNGEDYENVNSLVASTGEVYDSNNRLIFARNLYNNIVTNNTTTSILQIPNTLLNNITLSSQSLLSQTNKILTTNQEYLVKNIYETVYYNFYNTLMIEDRNTPIFKQNMTGAVRINNSTSLTTDYDNAKATKYRLNYSDDANLVLPIQPTIQEEDNISGNNSLYITNAEEQENIISYSVDGATEQDGTPTPDNPIKVKTIPSIINLFDKENISWYRTANGTFINTSNTDTTRIRTNSFAIDGGKTYVLSGIPSGITLYRVRTYSEYKGTQIDNITPSNNTFTLGSNIKYIHLLFSGSNFTDETNELMKNANIMLEESSIAHDYVPYGYWSRVKVTGKNLFNKDDVILNSRIGGDGSLISNSGYNTSGFIRVIPNTTYYRNKTITTNNCVALYDNNYNFIQRLTSGKSFTTTDSTYYIRTSINDDDLSDMLLEKAQEGQTEPTPYEPYKENQVLIDMSKENLFDKDNPNVLNAFISGSTITYSESAVSIYIQCQPNTIYTVSKSSLFGNDRFCVFDTETVPAVNGTILSSVGSKSGQNTSKSLTIKTSSNAHYLGVFVRATATAPSATLQEIFDTLAIYQSDNSTPYHELCKSEDGTVKDILSIDSNGYCSINKGIGKVVLNGSENIFSMGWASPKYAYVINVSNIKQTTNSNDTANLFCDYYTPHSQNDIFNTYNYSIGRRTNNGQVIIRNDDITSINSLKTWLSTHPTGVYYPLATPETINLPNTKIPLFEGINHVTFVDTLNTNTYLTYDIPNISTYTFDIYVPTDRTIDSLDIISNDELTTYHTIDTSSLENNKFYKITQNCHIE